MRYAVIDAENLVANVVEVAEESGWSAPEGFTLIATDTGGIGDTWDGTQFNRPVPAPAEPTQSYLLAVGLVRFTATAPIEVLENVGLGPVSRLAKGRYRATFNEPLPTSSYSVLPAVKDTLNVRGARVTARSTSFCEVRVTDATGLAADAEEVTIKIERVVTG